MDEWMKQSEFAFKIQAQGFSIYCDGRAAYLIQTFNFLIQTRYHTGVFSTRQSIDTTSQAST